MTHPQATHTGTVHSGTVEARSTGHRDSAEAPARRGPGRRPGEAARWRLLYPMLAAAQPGTMVTYESMANVLNLNLDDSRDRQLLNIAVRKAVDKVRLNERKVLLQVRGRGYELAQPGQVIELAHRHQARAAAEVRVGAEKINTIDLDSVDVTTAALIRATAMGFARQEAMMRQLDVRQERLEVAMQATSATAQHAIDRATETSSRVEANQAQIDDLRRMIENLQPNQPDGRR